VHLAAVFYVLIVVRQLATGEMLSPGWISLRLMVWLAAVTSSGVTVLMWANLRGFAGVMDADRIRRMGAGAAALTACAALLIVIALVHYFHPTAHGARGEDSGSFGPPAREARRRGAPEPREGGRRRGRVGAVSFALTLVASLALPLTARGPGVETLIPVRRPDINMGFTPLGETPRLTMILLDGASLDFIAPVAAEGRLPNFGRILDTGASMHLATLRPTQPGPVWTAVATGKRPPKNGVRSAASYRTLAGDQRLELLPDLCFSHALVRFGFFGEEPSLASAVRARPLWTILSGVGMPVSIVGWPLTHPAQSVRGSLVSDQFHRLLDSSIELDDPRAAYPPDLAPTMRAALDLDAPIAAGGDDPPSGAEARRAKGADAPDTFFDSAPCRADHLYSRMSAALAEKQGVAFRAVRYRCLDAAGHYFLRYAMPRAFGDVTEAERRRYGRLLEQYYSEVDTIVGETMASQRPGDLLLVVSGFGMEPLGVGKRLLERALGNAQLTGTHERAPDGFLLAYGTPVAAGRKPRASLVDVAPTILYFLSLPVGRDMDGYARTDIFTRAYTAERPIAFIPTWER
jgi:predicted AlkP superfamily phosphohydrolase/phosphomutase